MGHGCDAISRTTAEYLRGRTLLLPGLDDVSLECYKIHDIAYGQLRGESTHTVAQVSSTQVSKEKDGELVFLDIQGVVSQSGRGQPKKTRISAQHLEWCRPYRYADQPNMRIFCVPSAYRQGFKVVSAEDSQGPCQIDEPCGTQVMK